MNMTFNSRLELPVFKIRDKSRAELVTKASPETLRTLVTDAKFEHTNRKPIVKPGYLFGDFVDFDADTAYDGNYKWLRKVGDRNLFLPNMERMFPISYFQCASVSRHMDWPLVKDQDGVALGTLTFHGVRSAGYGRQVTALRPGLFAKEYPLGEVASPARTFVGRFMEKKGEFPAQGFRTPGWVHSPVSGWWTRMTKFVLDELDAPLSQAGLKVPVRATKFGMVQSHFHFFSILEKYNPDTCTFFTPVGELGFALHEMHEVSGLTLGDLPYEEFVPGSAELQLLKKASPEIYDTLWEVMCHFHICMQLTGARGSGIKQVAWAEYLFQNLGNKGGLVTRLPASTLEEVQARIDDATSHYTNEAKEDVFPTHTEFESFHYQALLPISDTALLAGYLMLWLKRCVVPTRPIDALAVEVIYPAVLLAHGRPVSLLSAMVGCLQFGLRELTSDFVETTEVESEGRTTFKTPNPRVPMPYTYLMAWYVLHCPSLMSAASAPGDSFIPFVQRLESAKWEGGYMVKIRHILARDTNFHIYRCFPDFEGGIYGAEYQDVAGPNGFTRLSEGVFHWLLSIRPGYLVFRQGVNCFVEPYQPYRFARQFGYDQVYVGNPRPQLSVVGNLYEGARAWYYSVAGCTKAVFRLPHKTANSYTSIGFCNWYCAASPTPNYNINSSCLKDIRHMYSLRRGSKTSRLRGIDEFLAAESQPAGQEEEQTAEPAPREEQHVAEPPITRASGKRKLSAEEAGKYDKQIRRKLLVDPPPEGQQKPKLMAEAIRAAVDEEQQESSVAGLPRRTGLRSQGPALSGGASSYHPPEDEEDELMAADAESAPVTDLPPSPVSEPRGHEENPSPSPSALIMPAEGLSPSPTTGRMTKPTAGSSLPEPSATQDDEERVDYEGSSIGGEADEEKDDEGAEVGNLSGDDIEDEERDSMEDITLFDDAPKAPSDKASGYTPFYLTGKLSLFRLIPHAFSAFRPFFRAGSPTPGTTSTAPLEQELVPASAPLQEQHLPGSPKATAPPATLPETTVSSIALPEVTATTFHMEQPVVQVSAPLPEQTLHDSSVVATPPTAAMKISLIPTEAGPSSSQAKALMTLPSSPSQLNISIASAASAPGTPASHSLNAPISTAEGASSGATVRLANAPKFLQVSLVYLNTLAKMVVESLMNGQGTLNSFRPLLEVGLNGIKCVGEPQWFERCSEIILRLEEKLQRLETMGHSDLQPQIVSTLANLQVAEVIQRESLERDLTEKERQVAELRERNIQKREELERSTTSLNSLRDRLVEAEAEVLRLKAEVSREENVVNILSTQDANGALEYHSQAVALEEARNKVAAIVVPSADELRAKAEAIVRANHEKELAELKTQLATFDLMHE